MLKQVQHDIFMFPLPSKLLIKTQNHSLKYNYRKKNNNLCGKLKIYHILRSRTLETLIIPNKKAPEGADFKNGAPDGNVLSRSR